MARHGWAWGRGLLTGLCLLSFTTGAWAAVGAPVASGYQLRNTVTTGTITFTVAGGHSNNALVVWVLTATEAVTVVSVTWDLLGANQVLTSMGSQVVNSNVRAQGFSLVNPTAGTSKLITVVVTPAISNMMIGAMHFENVDQSTPIRASSLTSNTTGDSLSVSTADGDTTIAAIVTTNVISTSASGTQIWLDDSPSSSASAGEYIQSSGSSNAHNWTGESGTSRIVIGASIQQVSAAAAPPQRLLLGVGASLQRQPGADLDWSPLTGLVSSVEVERRAGTGPYGRIATVGAITTYRDMAVTASQAYCYRVRPCSALCGAYSNEDCGVIQP